MPVKNTKTGDLKRSFNRKPLRSLVYYVAKVSTTLTTKILNYWTTM